MSSIVWTIIIGFVAGVIARFLAPGPNKPSGFVLTVLLGIAGTYVGTFVGQFFGYYRPGEQADFVGQVIGAIVLLFIWSWFARRKSAA